LWNVEEGHFNWVLGQHPVSILKGYRVSMISGFKESSCNDWRHAIPEKEVLIVAVSWVAFVSKLAYPDIPSAVKPIVHKELNSFRNMKDVPRA